jgi:hypothetical protein
VAVVEGRLVVLDEKGAVLYFGVGIRLRSIRERADEGNTMSTRDNRQAEPWSAVIRRDYRYGREREREGERRAGELSSSSWTSAQMIIQRLPLAESSPRGAKRQCGVGA